MDWFEIGLLAVIVAEGVACVAFALRADRSPALEQVGNRDAGPTEAASYFRVRCRIGGQETALLFTGRELDAGIVRARKNPEDL